MKKRLDNRRRSVIFLRSNAVDPDPRVEKEARALEQDGWSVAALGWDRSGEPSGRKTWLDVSRFSLRSVYGSGSRNIGKLIQFNVWLALALFRRRHEYTHIHACDFDTVWPAIVVGKIFGKRIVYDIFDNYVDYFPERSKMFYLRAIVKWLNHLAIEAADAVILVDDERTIQLAGAKPRRLSIIYNSPEEQVRLIPLSDGAASKHLVFVGVLYLNRGLAEVIAAIAVRPNWTLSIAGFGGDEDAIRALSEGVQNVTMRGRVDYSEAMRLNATADALFAIYDPSVPGHKYSSANKLFEAMLLGKPIIVARGTSMDVTVERFGLGQVVKYGDVDDIGRALDVIATATCDDMKALSRRARDAYAQHFAWSIMASRLTRLYGAL